MAAKEEDKSQYETFLPSYLSSSFKLSETISEMLDETEEIIERFLLNIAGTFAAIGFLLAIIGAGWGINSNFSEPFVFVTIIAGGGLVVLGYYISSKSWNLLDRIAYLNNEFRVSTYISKFELSPPVGKNPLERLLNQARFVYRDLDELIGSNPSAVEYDAKVKGKSGKEYDFDIRVHQPSDWKYKLWSRFGKEPYDFFFKRFEKKKTISRSDIEELMDELADIHHLTNYVPDAVIVASKSPFSRDAIILATKLIIGNEEEGCPLDLIQENEKGTYKIIWIG